MPVRRRFGTFDARREFEYAIEHAIALVAIRQRFAEHLLDDDRRQLEQLIAAVVLAPARAVVS